MATCRISRSTGNGQVLWPEGVSSATDAPVDLLRAIEHANKVLDWYENLSSDEVPPAWMWPFDKELSDWFDEVRESRKAKYSGGGGDDDVDGEDMMDNEYSERR